MSDLCKKDIKKISALATVAPFTSFDKRKLLINGFFTSLFSYCPLIWMSRNRTNRKINMFYERCLRIIFTGKQSSLNELLNKDSSVSIHIRNIRWLAIEMFKSHKALSTPIMDIEFKLKTENSCNVREFLSFLGQLSRLYVYHGPESIWNILPEKMRNTENLVISKKKIKTWKLNNYRCSLCKIYIEGVQFL